MQILMQEPEGSFVVRDSASNPGCLALSVKNSDGNILHFLIIRDHHGVYLQVSPPPPPPPLPFLITVIPHAGCQ